ncbi:MAG: OmpA family protein [Rhodobacteraceae bacterium]|nr:OmpA family protein [Paracoccaceae bacterium]
MRVLLFPIAAFAVAALLSSGIGFMASRDIEGARLAEAVEILRAGDFTWATPQADGLLIRISGIAPSRAERAAAHAALAQAFGSGRVAGAETGPDALNLDGNLPELRIAKNQRKVSLFGVLTSEQESRFVTERAQELHPGSAVMDLTQTAELSLDENWIDTLNFALQVSAAEEVQNVAARTGLVQATVIARSPEHLHAAQARLREGKPAAVNVEFRSAQPRPFVSPYIFSAELTPDTVQLISCLAENRSDAGRIVAAAGSSGHLVEGDCRIALGAPTSEWASAIEKAIGLLIATGSGRLVVRGGEIQIFPSGIVDSDNLPVSRLPSGYVLRVIQPTAKETTDSNAGDNHVFSLSRSADGVVTSEGALPDGTTRRIVNLTALLTLEGSRIRDYATLDTAGKHPDTELILKSIQALDMLHSGTVSVTPDAVSARGVSADYHAESEIRSLFPETDVRLQVEFDRSINEATQLTPPLNCVHLLNATQSDAKLSFNPGSTMFNATSIPVLESISEILKKCLHAPIEIAGHTDSQGRESMNLDLSNRRARAVIVELQDFGVSARNLVARGYGESQPIADNSTEDGREKNRRIEFRLLEVEDSFPQ